MNAPSRQMSSPTEILLSLEEEEKVDRRLILRFRYLLTSSHESAIVVGSSLESRAEASSSLLMDRMCINIKAEKKDVSLQPCADDSFRLM